MSQQQNNPPAEKPERADLSLELDPATGSIVIGIRTQYGIAPVKALVSQEDFWETIGNLMILSSGIIRQRKVAAAAEALKVGNKQGLKLS